MPRIPITGVALDNFKSFSSVQHAEIRPITLLFGGNNCGKSAFLRSLAYARELAGGTRPTETDQLGEIPLRALNQDRVDVGTYPDYLHDPSCPSFGLAHRIAAHGIPALTPALAEHDLTIATKLRADAGAIARDVVTTRGELRVAGETLVGLDGRFHAGRPLGALVDWALDEAANRGWRPPERALLERLLVNDRQSWMEDDGRFPPVVRFEGLADCPDAIPREDDALGRRDRRIEQALGHRPEETESAALAAVFDLLGRQVERTWRATGETLLDATERTDYLGPLRSIPGGIWPLADAEACGGHWWQTLALDTVARDAVNGWLQGAQGRGDAVSVHVQLHGPTVPISREQTERIATTLLPQARRAIREQQRRMRQSGSSSFPDLTNLTPEGIASHWAQGILSSSGVQQTAGVWIRASGVERLLAPSEIGVGLSQMIPIVAAALASRDRLLLVEQPELHVHPAMQAELGDLFIESALGERQNTWMIESHSEHLLLRVMRRIRETTGRRLPAGRHPVRPEDVSLCFFEKDGTSSLIHEVPLDENGQITRPWPGGFFEEGIREMFEW